MKFIINGREYQDYQLSNEQIRDLIEGGTLTKEEKSFLMEKAFERFKCECCAHRGESRDELFAQNFSDYVNKCPNDFSVAAKKMASEHRYLQNEMFKVFIDYAKELNKSYLNNFYDARNEWAVRAANKVISALEEEKLL